MAEIFINKDAEWLYKTATSLMRGEQPEDVFALGAALAGIARKHQALDDKYLALSSGNDAFEAGMREAYLRLYERSNLPPEERAMPKEAQNLGVGITVVPAGMTAAQLKAEKESRARRRQRLEKELGPLVNAPISISPALLAKIQGKKA